MSKNNDSYEDRILWEKGEFINFLKKNLKKTDDRKIDDKQIRKLVYAFIFEKVVGTGVKEIKIKKEPITKFYIDVVDYCLNFGGIILDIISNIEKKINDDDIDA